jgi:protein required for attachment to host cells
MGGDGMIKAAKTLVVLVDGERARFLSGLGRCPSFTPVEPGEMVDHDSRKQNRELATDKPGRAYSTADGTPSAMETTDFQRREKQLFARSVAQTLDKIAAEGHYDRLIVAAPPTALGDLRASLSKQTAERITAEVAKDLTKVPDHELRSHLTGVLPP